MAGVNVKSSNGSLKIKVYSSGTVDGRKVKNYLRPAANDDYMGPSPFFGLTEAKPRKKKKVS